MSFLPEIMIVATGLSLRPSSPPPYHLEVEAVLLDRTGAHSLSPTLYQMSEKGLVEEMDHSPSLTGNGVMILGHLTHIDRQAKLIEMSDGHLLSYQYLVIANGEEPPFQGFPWDHTPGMQALIDGLRLHRKLMVHSETFSPSLALSPLSIPSAHPQGCPLKTSFSSLLQTPAASQPKEPPSLKQSRFFLVEI